MVEGDAGEAGLGVDEWGSKGVGVFVPGTPPPCTDGSPHFPRDRRKEGASQASLCFPPSTAPPLHQTCQPPGVAASFGPPPPSCVSSSASAAPPRLLFQGQRPIELPHCTSKRAQAAAVGHWWSVPGPLSPLHCLHSSLSIPFWRHVDDHGTCSSPSLPSADSGGRHLGEHGV